MNELPGKTFGQMAKKNTFWAPKKKKKKVCKYCINVLGGVQQKFFPYFKTHTA